MEEVLHQFARCVTLVIEGIAIRTFLSYFLDHEMEATRRLQQANAPPQSNAVRSQQGAWPE